MSAPAGGALITEYLMAPDAKPPSFAKAGMALKFVAARDALLGGVGRVVVGGSHGARPVHAALSGAGTTFTLSGRRTVDVAG